MSEWLNMTAEAKKMMWKNTEIAKRNKANLLNSFILVKHTSRPSWSKFNKIFGRISEKRRESHLNIRIQ